MLLRNHIATLLAVLCTLHSFSQDISLDAAVRNGVLPNGFTYYIRKNVEPAKRVQLYLVNKVGSILETDEQRGLAHFMEHMSFNGTKHFPKNNLVNYLQKAGVRFGADLNAYTSFDETVYQLPLPSDDPAVLKNGLSIIRDWAQEALLDETEINKERGVVLEEKRLGKGAQERMSRVTLPVLLNHSRYADRLPIGTDEVLLNFKRKQILDYYSDWYRPDLQAIIVVGDIDVDKMEASIKSMFSSLKMPAIVKPRIKYEVPLTGANQYISVTDKEYPNTVLQILIKHKNVVAKSKAEYEQLIKRNIFNQMLGARFGELAQQPNPPFLQGGASMGGLMGGLDAFTVSVVAKPGQMEKGFKAVWLEIERAEKFGFTASEFERAKANYLNYFESAVKEKDKVNSESLVKEYVRHFLEGELAPGIEAEYSITKNYFSVLHLKDVNALAAELITDVNRDIVLMAPDNEKDNLPSEATVNAWISAVQKTDITAYADDFNAGDLISTLPAPGKIIKEKNIASVNATELTLSNGLRVILKPTTFKNDEILFNIFSPGGTSLYSDADYQSAANAAGIVSGSGLANFAPKDFPKILSGKSVSVSPYISDRSEGISGFSVPKDMETAMQLVHLYFTNPRKDTVVFNNIIDQSEVAIANRYTVPKNIFSDTVSAVLGKYSVRRTGPTLEKLKQIDLDKVYGIYRERFSNAADFTVVFVGSFNKDSIKPLIEKYLGSLPSSGMKETAKDLGIRTPAGNITKVVRKGSEAQATVQIILSGDYKYNTENNIKLSALSSILQFRITDRLREKDGGAYSPSVSHSFSKSPVNRYSFSVSFGCAPDNADKLVAAVKEELELFKTKGITKEELSKFITEQERQYELQIVNNNVWLGYLGNQYENNEDPATILSYKSGLKKLTTQSVQDAAKAYFNLDNFITFLLMPE